MKGGILILFFFKIIFAGAGFSNIPGKYENVVFIIKLLETGINLFKSNCQIVKIREKKYYEI